MFRKILIANRGEIACRVMETAQDLGVKTVAVFSDADAKAKHVALADRAVYLGPPPPAQSYLRGDLIIKAALETGAEAIHPGYGFLSENPDFVQAVEKAGLVFIGPSAKAIRAMGLKDAAKALMEKAGVPVVPGYHGENQDPKYLAEKAKEIGYPVLIKAVAGGGGKGMRLVEKPSDFQAALTSAMGEAKTAFGNEAVLVEKFVDKPRHIEVQVFGDGQDAVHLFERDCSLQRRHQKVIEEAPAPGMTADVRAAMGAAAVKAAKAIGYAGAGTIEFIVDGSDGLKTDGFWFMEMNTRLQVEHPVTEAITGVDLVEWQLRVASGEALPKRQEDLSITGHAFEARLYAEDVPKGFLPATGHLAHLVFPQNARADSGVRAGDDISPFYDPMIAKVIVHGPSRGAALRQLDAALGATEVAGTVTNLSFLRALARHKGFAAGDVDTGLIGRDLEKLVVQAAPDDGILGLAALVADGLDQGGDWQTGFALWRPLARDIRLTADATDYDLRLRILGAGHAVIEREGRTFEMTRQAGHWQIDGRSIDGHGLRHGNVISVFGAQSYRFEVPAPLDRAAAAAGPVNGVVAPMPGLVKRVAVKSGETVAAGDPLAVLEAMKMEHVLTAPRDGVVGEVLVAEGAQVEAGAPLILLEKEA